jgi:hypothetical protein
MQKNIIRPKIYIKFKKLTDRIEPMLSMTPLHLSTPTLPVLVFRTDIFIKVNQVTKYL